MKRLYLCVFFTFLFLSPAVFSQVVSGMLCGDKIRDVPDVGSRVHLGIRSGGSVAYYPISIGNFAPSFREKPVLCTKLGIFFRKRLKGQYVTLHIRNGFIIGITIRGRYYSSVAEVREVYKEEKRG